MKKYLLTLISVVLLGCSSGTRAQPPVRQAVAAPELKSDTPEGWKAVRAENYVFSVPSQLEDVKNLDGPKYVGMSPNKKFLVAFSYTPGFKTLKKYAEALESQIIERDIEISQRLNGEVNERDVRVIVASNDATIFISFLLIKDEVGYNFTCATSEDPKASADLCMDIVNTLKFK